MSELNTNYTGKIRALKLLIDSLDTSFESLLTKYRTQTFPETKISKHELFSEVLISKRISEKHSNYMEEKCGSLSHFRDRRTGVEYGVDLILGWFAEDALLQKLRSLGEDVTLGGEDRYREFLSAIKISTGPDITIKRGSGKLRKIELMCDWKETWKIKKHIDLRDNKYNKLIKEGSLFIGLAPISNEGFAIDFSKRQSGWVNEFIPTYRKEGYSNRDVANWLEPADVAIKKLLQMV